MAASFSEGSSSPFPCDPKSHFSVARTHVLPHPEIVVAENTDYRIKLSIFEGPLDLLLFLLRKNELDIYDIPIETVTRQYLEAIYGMKELALDVAGEFFVMAATLMEIKSRMLLPKGQHAVDPNAEEDDLDPRWELVHQLLQYKKFKEAAQQLNELSIEKREMVARYVSTLGQDMDRPLRSVDRIELWNAFNQVLRRLSEKLAIGEIDDDNVTVADRMEMLLEQIQTKRTFTFSSLFDGPTTVRMLVASFLAVLELTRLGKLRIRQDESFEEIICEARDEIALEKQADAVTVLS